MTMYKHYKGGLYEFICIAIHSETDEKLVVYKSLQDNKTYVRPYNMFFENVIVNGIEVPRFKAMEEE